MDLKNKNVSTWGKNHWSEGYQIAIGRDGIARNVPQEAADELLTNPGVWERLAGATPPLKGIVPQALGGSVSLPQVRTVEVPLVPKSLAFLESLSNAALAHVCHEFDVNLATVINSGGNAARALLAEADEQLCKQLRSLVQEQQPAPITPSPDQKPAPASVEPEKSVPEATQDDLLS